jgi:Fe-S-cluster containining protein
VEADGRRIALRAIYAAAERAIAARPELHCQLSGRCCRFREAGHELYLTRLEYEEMAERGGTREADPAACPWLENGLCANREGRALGCRTYFCSDEAAAAEVTETFHAEIRALHEQLAIPYVYASLHQHMSA